MPKGSGNCNTNLPALITVDAIARILPRFNGSPELALRDVQALTGLADAQTLRWRTAQGQPRDILWRESDPKRTHTSLMFAIDKPLAGPVQDRAAGGLKLLGRNVDRYQPIPTRLVIPRGDRAGSGNVMAPPGIHHPPIGPR